LSARRGTCQVANEAVPRRKTGVRGINGRNGSDPIFSFGIEKPRDTPRAADNGGPGVPFESKAQTFEKILGSELPPLTQASSFCALERH
jgi:hypothetical protein